ncbi:MAG: class I SAM-dependent methyltransferase [Candidatus Melainabacteria bacterium]|nr:class I SAM-dependent methyltransferase [Candidatus Melainabacteria bacterium]
MRPVAAITYSFLNRYGLWTMAEFVRTVNEQGGQSKNGKEHNYFNTLRGLAQWIISPITREEINRAVRNSVIYRDGDRLDPFTRRVSKRFGIQAQRIKTLISRSPLSEQELKIFDAASNHGHITEELEQKIKRYTGMDIFNEVIQSAWKEAVERFQKIGCNDYNFVHGNILLGSSYKGLPRDNNLVICTGVMGHFRTYQIVQLLDNLASTLDNSDNSRIIISFPVISQDYDSSGLIVSTDEFGNILPKPRREEDGIKYVLERSRMTNFEFRRYEKNDILKLIQQNKRLEIADTIEPSEELCNIYLCLKRKPTNKI